MKKINHISFYNNLSFVPSKPIFFAFRSKSLNISFNKFYYKDNIPIN